MTKKTRKTARKTRVTSREARAAAKSRTGGGEWSLTRIQVGFKLIAILPQFPGVEIADICEDLGITERAFYRLVSCLRESSIPIESQFTESGHKVYFLRQPPRELMEKLFGPQVKK